MNPEFENTRQALEARLTALLLDELPEGEALALKEIVERDAELSKLYRRLKQTIDLVRETTVQPVAQGAPATAPLKLSDQRRQELLQRFKTVRPKEFEEPKRTLISRLVPVAAVAAVILLVAAIAMPNFTKARATSIKNAVINNLRQIDAAKQQWALENQKSQAEVPTPSDLAPYFHDGRLPQISDETYVLGRVGDPVVAEVEAAQARKSFGGFTAKLPAGGTRGQKVSLSMDGQIAYVNNAAKTSFGNQSMSGSDIRANPPAFVGPPVASASSDFATTPARRTMPSIVLPVGNADQDDLNRIAPAPDVPPAALVPPAESVATFGIPAKGDVSGVAGGAAQQFSRAKLQEGLRNSGDAGDPGKFVPHSVSGGGGGAGPAAIPQQTVTLADSPPAATVAPARPSNEESFRARYGSPPRSPSPLASAKPGQSAADGRGLYYESAVADRSGEARTPAAVGELTAGVPVLTTNIAGAIDPATGLPPGVNAFAEGAGNQNKALGFDWYLGNSLAGKDKPAAQSGLPPAEGDKLTVAAKPTRGGRVLNRESAAASAEPRSLVKSFTGLAPGANSSPATPRQEIVLPDDTLQQNKELALQLHRDTDGAVDRLSEKSPVLGDVPLAGRMFRPESDSSGTRGEERGRLQVTNTSGVAWNGGLSGVQTQNHFFDLGDITKSGATLWS